MVESRTVVVVSIWALVALACTSVVKIPQDCYTRDRGIPCGSDLECGSGAMCDTALSSPACVSVNCLPEGALCSNDAFCQQGAQCNESVCTTPTTTCSGDGFMTCDGSCVNTNTDPNHCGACDQPVPDGMTCVSGQPSCGTSSAFCNGVCIDTTSDSNNCGVCGHVCKATYACDGPAGPSQCSKAVNVTSTLQNCAGACGTYATCAGGVMHYTDSSGAHTQNYTCDLLASPSNAWTSWYLVCTCVSKL